eukprot:gene23006-53895_t
MDAHNRFGLNMTDPNDPHPLFTPPGTPLENDQQVAYLCNGEWHERSLIKNFRAMMIPVGGELHPQPYSGAEPAARCSAGLLFGPGRMIIEVPFDPYLRGLRAPQRGRPRAREHRPRRR